MREPSRKAQQRLLEVAYEAGFRHFDVAPSYGLGAAEAVLGRFLARRPSGVTVATKVGIVVRRYFASVQALQRPARAIVRRFPMLRGSAARAVGTAIHSRSNFLPQACTHSLESSLRALKLDAVDLLLLHDPDPSDLADGRLLEWLSQQKQRGVVRSIGLATSPEIATTVISSTSTLDAVQTPSNVLTPASARLRGAAAALLRITHGAIGMPIARIEKKMAENATWAALLADCVGTDVRAPGALARLLLALEVRENRNGIVLVGASKPEHLREAAEPLRNVEPAQLDRLTSFLQSTLGA